MDYYIREDPIDVLKLSVRLHNILMQHHIRTVGALLDTPESQLKDFYGMGVKTIKEVQNILAELRSLPKKPAGYAPVSSEPAADISAVQKAFYEKPIEKFEMSVRLYHCLKRAGISNIGQLLEYPEDRWSDIRNMGAKSIAELKELIHSIDPQSQNGAISVAPLNEEWKILGRELDSFYKLPHIHDILGTIAQKHPDCHGESIIYLAYENDSIHSALIHKILEFLEKIPEGMTLEQIAFCLPDHLNNTTIPEEVLLELQNKRKVQETDDIYSLRFPTAMEFAQTISNDMHRQIVQERFSGKTFEEIGASVGHSKQWAQSLCERVVRQHPTVQEDRYRYLFETYELNKENFFHIFNEPNTVFYYLEAAYSSRGKIRKPISEILSDETVSVQTKRAAETYIYRNHLSVDGVRISKTRPELTRYVVKRYCRNITPYQNFLQIYSEFLEAHDLSGNEKLIINSRTYANKLSRCDYTLWSWPRSLRYYNIAEQDWKPFLAELNLPQYWDQELSTLKVFRDHSELMEEYDIRNEFELHNLLDKIWPEYGTCDVEFSKMPTIRLGNYNVDEQALNLLLQCAPITPADLAQEYEQEYGVKAATALGNCFHGIDPYLVNGTYVVDQESLPIEQHTHMAEILTEDFYTLADIQRLYQREYPSENRKLNSYNIKSLGFLVNSSYAVRNTYSNGAAYFRHLLRTQDVTDSTDFSLSMTALSAYQAELADMKSSREIIEFSPKQYINIRRLNEAGVTAQMLDDYCQKVNAFVDRSTYFTITSIRQDGFTHELDDLYFDEWFYSSILAEDHEHFSYRRMGGNRLFYSGNVEVQLSDFLQRILEKKERIDLDDLVSLLDNRYGIQIRRRKLLWVLKDTNLYYDPIMDRVYIDYDTYFEEV